MKKRVRNILIVVLVFISLIISVVTVINLKSDKDDKSKNNSTQDGIEVPKFDPNDNWEPTYEEILTRTKNDYSGEDVDIELIEEEARYVLTIKSKADNSIIHKFDIDKKTGLYTEIHDTVNNSKLVEHYVR